MNAYKYQSEFQANSSVWGWAELIPACLVIDKILIFYVFSRLLLLPGLASGCHQHKDMFALDSIITAEVSTELFTVLASGWTLLNGEIQNCFVSYKNCMVRYKTAWWDTKTAWWDTKLNFEIPKLHGEIQKLFGEIPKLLGEIKNCTVRYKTAWWVLNTGHSTVLPTSSHVPHK